MADDPDIVTDKNVKDIAKKPIQHNLKATSEDETKELTDQIIEPSAPVIEPELEIEEELKSKEEYLATTALKPYNLTDIAEDAPDIKEDYSLNEDTTSEPDSKQEEELIEPSTEKIGVDEIELTSDPEDTKDKFYQKKINKTYDLLHPYKDAGVD